MPTGIPSSSSLSREFMSNHPHAIPIEVEVIRLDQFVADHGLNVDLVKIDTETTEPDVLAGMANTLERDKPDVFLEVLEQTDGEAMDAVVLPLGYRLLEVRPDGGRIERESFHEGAGNFHRCYRSGPSSEGCAGKRGRVHHWRVSVMRAGAYSGSRR